jgi:transposase
MTCQNCARLQQENARLAEENLKLQQENTELRRRLEAYENPHTPPSRKLVYPKPPRRTDGPRFPGRPRGHRGSTRPRPQPDVVVEPPPKDRCTCCGSPLGEPGLVGHRIVEEISNPAPRQVVDYLEYGYECTSCGSYTTAKHPDCPPVGRLGKNALVQATLLKFQDRLPHVKVSEALERTYGLKVTPATVLDVTRRVAWWLWPEYTRILRRIRASPVVYVDETSVRVDGRRCWIWVFTTETCTLIVIRKSRGKKVLEEVLGKKYKGVIVCDGWSSYPGFTDLIQRCWAHLLREADCLAEQVEEARPLSLALHRLYDRVKVWAVDKPPPEEAVRLMEEGKKAMTTLAGMPWTTEKTRRFTGKVMNGLDYWFTFLTAKGCEPTNNRAERALREHVVQRKIMGCFRNGKGTWIYETVMTVLSTWKQQGRDLPQALGETLTQEWTKS